MTEADRVWERVPDGATIFVAGSCATPVALVEAMARNADRWTDIQIVTPYLYAPLAVFAQAGHPFRFLSLHPTPVLRDLPPGCVDMRPLPFSSYATVFGASLPVDAAVIQVTPPGRDGIVSLGPSVGSVLGAVAAASIVIAQVNSAVPYIYGDGELRPDDRWSLIEEDSDLIEATTVAPSDALRTLGEHAAGLVENGSTVQFGVGAAPAAVAAALAGHRNLILHGGLCTPESAALIDAGAVTGTAVAAELAGDRQLFAWADRNPALRLVAAQRSHGNEALSDIERFVAVNSVVEVGLDGSANAEHMNGRRVSGPGGLPDFAMASRRSWRGRSILALPSSAQGGAVSRVVDRLPAGATTLPAWMADTVVTEHGAALIRHLPERKRAEALIEVADPRFRPELRGALPPPG